MGAYADLIAAELATATVTLQGGSASGFTVPVGGKIMPDDGTATATGGAATLSKQAGVITTEALTTAGLAAYTLTLTNTQIAAADMVFASVQNGTNTAGTPVVGRITPAAGSCTIEIRNLHATNALNGTLKIAFLVSTA